MLLLSTYQKPNPINIDWLLGLTPTIVTILNWYLECCIHMDCHCNYEFRVTYLKQKINKLNNKNTSKWGVCACEIVNMHNKTWLKIE